MRIVALLLSLFMPPIFVPRAAVVHAQQKPEELAQKSAEAWLVLSDSGKYAECWEEASTNFKAAVSNDKWVGMVSSVRDPLGARKAHLRRRDRLHDSRQGRPMARRRLLHQARFSVSHASGNHMSGLGV